MQRERITALTEYYAKDENSDKQSPFFLRAVSKDGLWQRGRKTAKLKLLNLQKITGLKVLFTLRFSAGEIKTLTLYITG